MAERVRLADIRERDAKVYRAGDGSFGDGAPAILYDRRVLLAALDAVMNEPGLTPNEQWRRRRAIESVIDLGGDSRG